jgi:cobalamin biosynthesis protein CbiG
MQVLSPPVSVEAGLVAGIACRRGAPAAELIALIEAVLAEAGHPSFDLTLLATLEAKAGEAAVVAAAQHFRVLVRTFPADDLTRFAASVPTPSATVARHTGLKGVAEAAVLACGELVLAKRKSAHATCALGRLAGAPQ